MDEKTRHQKAFAFFRTVLKPFIKSKFNYTYDDLGDIPGPYLLLSNHNTDFDPILVGLAAKNQLYFVASEHITHKGVLSKLLMRYFKPIIHTKGKTGVQSTINMLRAMKDGNSVCLFPEGNRSFNGLTCSIPAVTGKLAKRAGVPLVTFRLEGGYFTQPRWSRSIRRGKMRGRLVHIYSTDELKTMSNDAVNKAIVNDLYEDAYKTESVEMVPFKGKKLALGLDSTLFMCPKCRKIGTLSSDNHKIFCTCGYSAKLDVYGILTSSDGEKLTITDWDKMQRDALGDAVLSCDGETELFSDSVTVVNIGDDHEIKSSVSGALKGFSDGFEFNGKKISLDDIAGCAIYSRNVLVVHMGQDFIHYEIRGNDSFSALKYIYLHNILSSKEG